MTFLHLFPSALWPFLSQNDKIHLDMIILVLRSCKLIKASWSFGQKKGLWNEIPE